MPKDARPRRNGNHNDQDLNGGHPGKALGGSSPSDADLLHAIRNAATAQDAQNGNGVERRSPRVNGSRSPSASGAARRIGLANAYTNGSTNGSNGNGSNGSVNGSNGSMNGSSNGSTPATNGIDPELSTNGHHRPRALITGITGQDGSYLAELLLERGYEVHGIIRRSSSFNTARIDHLYHDPHDEGVRLFTHYGDLADPVGLTRLIDRIQPEEIYHLGAQSHVMVSFEIPEYTFDVTGGGTLRLLEAVRESGVDTRFTQCCSSEMFGSAPPPQSEGTPFQPRSPYAIAKLASYWAGVNYRDAYGMRISNAILFNHESPRRGESFVTRKITRAVARIKAGLQDVLYLGNLDAYRDWGYSPDYMEALWLITQRDEPEDFVIATGETHTVREFLDVAFEHAGLGDWGEYVEIDPKYFRPTEVDSLLGDASKLREALGWEPRVRFDELVQIMVDADVEELDDQLAGKVTVYSHEVVR
jgi:GDPmannose 4,6-dehydratase